MHRATPLSRIAVPLLAALLPSPARADLLISEMCDPRLDYAADRFLEIWNSGPDPVDLTDWSLVAVGNGVDIFTWSLSGTIAPGDALVAGDATTVTAFPVDFPAEAWSTANGNWNGRAGDGAMLRDPSLAIVDYAVVDGTRFENQDYVRIAGVTSPNPVYTSAEWTAIPVDHPTQASPGWHGAPPVPVPSISSVTIAPIAPLPADTVHVQAVVTDAVATITSVVLAWGTSPASLPDSIPMTPLVGNVYRTGSPIPGQSPGTTIHFRIRAVNDSGGAAATTIYSYSIPVAIPIAGVQGTGAASPYVGQPVITGGVVTGVFGAYAALQDGAGPWSGVWVTPATLLAQGDSVVVRGTVSETHAPLFDGTTVLTNITVLSSLPGAAVPAPAAVTTGTASVEAYEGVLLQVTNALCTQADEGSGWTADDGSGNCGVGHLGFAAPVTLGTVYDIRGVLRDAATYALEPRDAGDVPWVADPTPPSIAYVSPAGPTALLVTFTEPVEAVTASNAANYGIPGLTVNAAARDSVFLAQVLLGVSPMSEGPYTLTVSGVEDLFGNAASGAVHPFAYVDYFPPAGYYDAAAGLSGEALRAALHDIIDAHTPVSYDFAWTAYYTTDDKPNGKVWDIYSDVPGGVPPYEYTFGVDEGGEGGAEGNGYSREHSFPKSWFGGEVAPMFTDLFALYPCDAHVNGNRGTYPYGEVDSPTWVSLNGSRRGTCSTPGYTGVAFEPIDAYKGDLARTYFYMSTRYYGEDGAWPGGPMTDGADLLPWAKAMLLAWHEQDPVSQKEIERNGTIHGFQNNRNPFIDHPEFVDAVFGDATGAEVAGGEAARLSLEAGAPNPFGPSTQVRFALPAPAARVALGIFDVAGRRVRALHDGPLDAGAHERAWDGRNDAGERVAAGTYFVRLVTEDRTLVRKATLVR